MERNCKGGWFTLWKGIVRGGGSHYGKELLGGGVHIMERNCKGGWFTLWKGIVRGDGSHYGKEL